MSSRSEILLSGLSKEARILEIGPSHAPLAAKRDGWRTKTLDHLSREELIRKYEGHPGVRIDQIEEVDFIWTGGPISRAIAREELGTFDVVLASHVIEHVPDFIGFFASATELATPDGQVVLAVPDKRYCFDFFQPVTTTGQLLAANLEARSRNTPRLAYDYYAYTIADGEQIAFGHEMRKNLRFVHTLDEAMYYFKTIADGPNYVDIHAWRFTPASFQLLIFELALLKVLDWRVERITPAYGFEFYVWLRRGGQEEAAALSRQEADERRMVLLKRGLVELRQQIDCLI